jgi:hypothetical protein
MNGKPLATRSRLLVEFCGMVSVPAGTKGTEVITVLRDCIDENLGPSGSWQLEDIGLHGLDAVSPLPEKED